MLPVLVKWMGQHGHRLQTGCAVAIFKRNVVVILL